MTFAQFNLDSNIFKALNHCGYTKPTPIQIKAIPEILSGKDLVASAQTGTGKTAAFVLPALQRLILNNKKHGKARVLILTPTRELAIQVNQAVEKYSKFLSLKIASLMGGMSYRQQLRKLSGSLDIVVATPGRLLDHLENRRINLSNIEMLVIDEADRMLDMGFIDDVTYIAKKTPQQCQTLLFSATFDNRVNKIIVEILKNPTRIILENETFAPAQIKQELYLTHNEHHKKMVLQHLLANENIFKAIIFTATKSSADILAAELSQNYPAVALHGDLKQNRRNAIVTDFRKGKIQFLVATDVAGRGIDIPDVSHVFNFDLPKFCEDYVHRIGRTGRAGKKGVAISFASKKCERFLQKIERFIDHKIERKVIPGLEHNRSEDSPSKPKRKFKNGLEHNRSEDSPSKSKRKFKNGLEHNRSENSRSKPKRKFKNPKNEKGKFKKETQSHSVKKGGIPNKSKRFAKKRFKKAVRG